MIFSILNIQYTNFEKSLSNLNFILGRDQNHFFIHRRKTINYGFPCVDFKKKETKLGCENVSFLAFNLHYFLYVYQLNKDENKQSNYVTKDIIDYASYKGDIISHLYTTLDIDKKYYHKHTQDKSFYHVLDKYDGNQTFMYLYFFRNFIAFGGREMISSGDETDFIIDLGYDFVIKLNYEDVLGDLYRGVLKSLNKIQKIRENEKYQYKDILMKIDKNYFVRLINSILLFLQQYFKMFIDIEVEYHRMVENDNIDNEYDEDDDEYGYNDYFDNQTYVVTYDCDIYYFVFLNPINSDFIINLSIDYKFFDYVDQNYYHLFGDPLNMQITLIKKGNDMKIITNVVIDKNVQEMHKTFIDFDKNLIRKENHKYIEKDEGRFYNIDVLSVFEDRKDDFISNINESLNKITQEFNLEKVYTMII